MLQLLGATGESWVSVDSNAGRAALKRAWLPPPPPHPPCRGACPPDAPHWDILTHIYIHALRNIYTQTYSMYTVKIYGEMWWKTDTVNEPTSLTLCANGKCKEHAGWSHVNTEPWRIHILTWSWGEHHSPVGRASALLPDSSNLVCQCDQQWVSSLIVIPGSFGRENKLMPTFFMRAFHQRDTAEILTFMSWTDKCQLQKNIQYVSYPALVCDSVQIPTFVSWTDKRQLQENVQYVSYPKLVCDSVQIPTFVSWTDKRQLQENVQYVSYPKLVCDSVQIPTFMSWTNASNLRISNMYHTQS